MKKLKTVIAVAVLLIAAYFYAHVAKKDLLYDNHLDSSEYTGYAMVDETTVEQTFRTEEQSIDSLYLKLTTAGDVSDIKVAVTLTDTQTNEIVGSAEQAASEIRSGKFVCFSFGEGIEDTAGKEYRITVKVQGSDVYNYPTVYFQSSPMPEETLRIGAEEIDGALIARVITFRFDLETYVIALAIVAFIYGFMKLLYKLFK